MTDISEENAGEETSSEEEVESSEDGAREKPNRGKSPKRSANPKNATELLTDFVVYQASRAASKLRQSLIGSIGVEVTGIRKSFLLDWTEDSLKATECQEIDKAECQIRVSESDLLEIARGKLNPQVAMLSHKIHVSGNLSFAMYFFNLFAARVRG
jgi:putative sterol carrier protein